jgi:hypothetical protein
MKAATLSVSGTWSERVEFRMTAMPAPDLSFRITPGHKRKFDVDIPFLSITQIF